MTSLLDDVLTIGKNDTVALKINSEEIDLQEFMRKICGEARCAIADCSHQIILSVNQDVPSIINSDERFLRNIFLNLLTNAIKYSPGREKVYLNVFKAESGICFAVRDEGAGMSQYEVSRIFEPFYRTNATKAIQGTGLGLAIVKRAADLINASLSVESNVNEGSTFSVRLQA